MCNQIVATKHTLGSINPISETVWWFTAEALKQSDMALGKFTGLDGSLITTSFCQMEKRVMLLEAMMRKINQKSIQCAVSVCSFYAILCLC